MSVIPGAKARLCFVAATGAELFTRHTHVSHTRVWPNTETYTQAITACARVGEWQRALLLLEEMVKKVRGASSMPMLLAVFVA